MTKLELSFDIWVIYTNNWAIVLRGRLSIKGNQARFDPWVRRQVKEEIFAKGDWWLSHDIRSEIQVDYRESNTWHEMRHEGQVG